MAGCRIQNLKPPCAYNVEGIQRILLLDFEDFLGFKFDGDDLYHNCLVSDIIRAGEFVELDAAEGAKYSSSINGSVYTHTIETFIGDLSAYSLSNLHLATKRRYMVIFQTNAGRYHAFAYEAGALLSYASQTADAVGSLVTLSCSSIYPLFEADAIDITTPLHKIYDLNYSPQYE